MTSLSPQVLTHQTIAICKILITENNVKKIKIDVAEIKYL